MIYLIAPLLIITGIVIIAIMVWMGRKDKCQENDKESGSRFLVFLEVFSVLLGSSNVLLPLGLIVLGIVLFFYH